MPHPTLTWEASNLQAFTVAGTNSTPAELLLAVKDAIDNLSEKWEVSDYDATDGTLEIKRKAADAPTGELATARFLLFGGQVPHANALAVNLAAANTHLYAAMSVDANTTGPSTSYAAGAPYASKCVLGQMVTANNAIQAADSPRVSLVESADALAIWLGDSSTWCSVIFGRVIIAAADDSLMWGVLASCGARGNVTTSGNMDSTASGGQSPLPLLSGSGGIPRGGYWNTTLGQFRACGRAISLTTTIGTDPGIGGNAAPSTLIPVPVLESTNTLSSPTQSFLGYLRQIRLGPQAQHVQTMRDADGDEIAIHFGPPNGVSGWGCWFDQAQ